jgi:hypothetical protein
MKTNIFTNIQKSRTDEEYLITYENLKTMPVIDIKKAIEDDFKEYGTTFLDKMIVNSILDIERETSDSQKKQRIAQIENLCNRLLINE